MIVCSCKNVNTRCSYSKLIITNALLMSWLFNFVSKKSQCSECQSIWNLITWQVCSLTLVIISLTLNFVLQIFFKALFILSIIVIKAIYFLNKIFMASPRELHPLKTLLFLLLLSFFTSEFQYIFLIFLSPSCSSHLHFLFYPFFPLSSLIQGIKKKNK